MQNIRRSKKKKVVPVPKDVEELAQDKLHEISIFAEDRFQDQSQMLSIDHRTYTDPYHKEITMNQQIRKLITKKRRQWNLKRYSASKERSNDSKDTSHSNMGQTQLLILNKLESNSVFVGVKSGGLTTNLNSTQETHILLLQRKKRMNSCPTPHPFDSYKSILREEKGRGSVDKEDLRVGESRTSTRKSSMSRSMDWKIRNKSRASSEWIRNKMRSSLHSPQTRTES